MSEGKITITRCVRENLNKVTHNSQVMNELKKKYHLCNGQAVLFIGMDGTRARMLMVVHSVPLLVLFPTDSRLGTRRLLAELIIAWVNRTTIQPAAFGEFQVLMPARKAA